MRNSRIVHAMRVLARTPPNFFSIAFGLAGLAVVWQLMATFYGSPAAVGDALFIAAAAVWLVLAVGAIARLVERPRAVLSELRDPILSPFWALPWIVGMLLGLGLEPHAHAAGKVLFIVFLIATILYGGWVTGQWFVVDLDRSKLHPGYFLPTVAGGLLGGECAGDMGMHALGWLSFGIGIVCWLMLGSLIINRLFFTAMLPAALVPTLAIEVAPPAVAGGAYFALHGTAPDVFAYGLAGYAVLMVLVQVRLLPLYARLRFTPGFWAFTFSWAAVAELALYWLRIERPAGEVVYAALAAGAVSLLTAAIGARSVLAIARGQFLPPLSPAPTTAPAPSAATRIRPPIRLAQMRAASLENTRTHPVNIWLTRRGIKGGM
jgi:tellurite resistance protein